MRFAKETVSGLQMIWLAEMEGASKLGGFLLFQVSLTFLLYLVLGPLATTISSGLWIVLFWFVQLLAALQASERLMGVDFGLEKPFLFQTISSGAALISRMIAQFGLQLLGAGLGYATLLLLTNRPISFLAAEVGAIAVGCATLTTGLLLVGVVASATSNPARYGAILGIPISIPGLLLAIKATKLAADGLLNGGGAVFPWALPALGLMWVALAVILMPSLWNE